MNPFDLSGPEFLAFYVGLGFAVLVALRFWLWGSESGDQELPRLTDPYAIAYLRGGRDEALRVATVSLIDRGLLKASNGEVLALEWSEAMVRRPLEKIVLTHFKTRNPACSIFEHPPLSVCAVCQQYQEELERLDLVPGADRRRARAIAITVALVVLLGTAAVKICVAVSRGHHNVIFLLVLAGIAIFSVRVVTRRPRTALGDRLLSELRRSFRGLRARARDLAAGGASSEVVLLAALWGLAALPAIKFPFVKTAYPKAVKSGSDGGSWTGGCGSGCGGGGWGGLDIGGGGDGGGGGGCGGGGCGGGCGGCGG
ncbi:MAG TPA: TIGR04222 domain-containing membrane protein [Planctomycetota bacterium]|nr:TIGR04222 domain-containing membrane protein [Planctomycetota bacterium]